MYIKGFFPITVNDDKGDVIKLTYDEAVCDIISADPLGEDIYATLCIYSDVTRETPVFNFTATVSAAGVTDQNIAELKIFEEAINNVCHGFTYVKD
ncbi:hypothetical protein CPT_Moabite_199 [Serratia phage Moabite]|uniref:Uncharacterized protein n=1 Tax=Serratia phage Moabite TaxID=2587814 RepID=A0A4Y5TQJ4_9CAUD|nr:hypothetical protein HWC48_gp217 [Serratia phage Moabite]QDB71229.1 hypothetical protein CPT_Moabite_199 [Serratia phage Moabite]UGO54085.1 hypothetical protein HAYMO_103 [Serratia phage vB_SmaM_Haymo]